jgi:hypothetical protein
VASVPAKYDTPLIIDADRMKTSPFGAPVPPHEMAHSKQNTTLLRQLGLRPADRINAVMSSQ